MAPLLIGYARLSTDEQDLTAQSEALAALGVGAERIYVDHGLTGTNRDRPGRREALAASREPSTAADAEPRALRDAPGAPIADPSAGASVVLSGATPGRAGSPRRLR